MSSTERNASSRGRRAAKACTFCRLRKFRCNSQSPRCTNCIQYGKECVYDNLPKRPRPSFARLAALEEENKRLQDALQEASSTSQGGTPSRDTPTRDTAVPRNGTEERRSISRSESSPQQAVSIERDSRSLDDEVVAPTVVVPGTPVHSPPSGVNDTATSPGPTPRPPTVDLSPAEPKTPVAGTNAAASTGRRGGGGSDTRYHGPTSTLFDETAAREARGERLQAPHTSKAAGGGTSSSYWVQKSLFAEAASQRHRETINLAAGKLDFDGVDPDLGTHLLRLHWNRQHHSFLITYRPAFMRDMACGGPYFSRLLLNAIFFGASKFSNRPEVRRDPNDVRTAGWLFRERVRELLGGALDRSDITTIQALLVMTSSLFALGDERSAAWLYAGTAFRMIIDLGMHVDGSGSILMAQRGSSNNGLTEEDVEIRRRVFWGAFVVDKIQSLYQGRPVSLQEIETSVPLAFNDEYEELENWSPFAYSYSGGIVAREYPGSPAFSVSCFTQLCRLSLIMNGILNAVYAERSAKKKPEALAEDLQRLHADLVTWKDELPAHLNFDPSSSQASISVTPPPHVLSLLAMHNVLLILLHRPFVSDGHLHANLRALSTRSFMTCAEAATAIVALLRSYNAAFSVRRAPYLISYATYVAATIHVRIAAQPGFATEAKDALAICLMVFDENSETNWAVKRARAVIGGLMQRMAVSVEAADATNTTSRAEDAEALIAEAPKSTAETDKPTAAVSASAQFPPRTASKRSSDQGSQDNNLLHTPRRRRRQRRDAVNNGALPKGADAASIPMEATSSGASLSSASASPADMTGRANDSNVPSSGEVVPAATFDIDAIISSFVSNQQPPMAGAFKSLPSPSSSQQQQHPHPLQQPQQRPQTSHAQQPGRHPYAEHFLPSSHNMAAVYPSQAGMQTPHTVPSSGGPYHQPHPHNSLSHGGAWLSPPVPPPGLPLPYHNAMLQPQGAAAAASPGFSGYAAAGRQIIEGGEGQQSGLAPPAVSSWQAVGGGGGGPDQAMNVHASDLLFGFNSSVLDGVGWEFDDGRNY